VIQFLLNQDLIKLEAVAPSLSILDWLRIKKGKTGTKEGCASGDCGACTVIVGDKKQGRWQYKSINACLMLVGSLHGKHLVTIEAVSKTDFPQLEDLHPVQKAMVECHGSQCGFCTPGIIMSMLALYLNHQTYPGKLAAIHALGGNLCRCTGYSPILKAVEKCFEYPRADHDWQSATQLLENKLIQSATPFLVEQTRHFYLPQNLAELVRLRAEMPNTRLVAGATDLSLEFSQQLKESSSLISLTQCQELLSFQSDQSGIFIGAATPYSEFVGEFCKIYPEASELFERLGSCQVRNAGTLGGSIGNASPIGDPAPLLIALNASIELTGKKGKRQLPLDEYFIAYKTTQLADDEVISGFYIPPRPANLTLACHKISKRIEDDISAVCLVLALSTDDSQINHARVALGGMAAIPARAKQVEQALLGQTTSLVTFQTAASLIHQDFSPLSDVRASSDYRIKVSENLFTRIWHENFGRIDTQAQSLTIQPSATRVNHAAL